MTAESVRDLGYIAWEDPFAWMESMRGKRWETMLQHEKRHYHSLSNQPQVKRTAKAMEQELTDVLQYVDALPPYEIGNGTIQLYMTASSRFQWKWEWSNKRTPAYDIDVQGNIVWYVTSEEDAHFKNRLRCEDATGKQIWTKEAISTQIAVIGEACYYIKVVDYFRTVELCICHAQTGHHESVLYREENEENDLTLIKGSNRTLYLQSKNPMQSKLFRIDGKKVKPLYVRSAFQWPLGESIYGDDCVLTMDHVTDRWTAHGKPIQSWGLAELQREEACDLLWLHLQSGHVITMKEGSQTLWWCTDGKPPKKLLQLRIGSIEPNLWAWDGVVIQSFVIKSPTQPPFMIKANHRILPPDPSTTLAIPARPMEFAPLEIHRFHTPSRDGTPVPFLVLKQKGVKPKALFVYVYGAYGVSTPLNWPYQTWYPLLSRRWAIVFALVRGGGDVDAAWADAARREHRHLSVEDYEAVIRRSQQLVRIGPEKTVLYGRSAGGVPVGSVVARHPHGDLAGAAFTEVPYVDILRTSSNPELPLTVGEYKEFGNPIQRVMNFKELMNVSPLYVLPPEGAPGVFVLSHVGLLDRQVFAYESFKWMQYLRGAHGPATASSSSSSSSSSSAASSIPLVHEPRGKYITFERDEAHQYRAHRMSRFRASDFAILDQWAEGHLRFSSIPVDKK